MAMSQFRCDLATFNTQGTMTLTFEGLLSRSSAAFSTFLLNTSQSTVAPCNSMPGPNAGCPAGLPCESGPMCIWPLRRCVCVCVCVFMCVCMYVCTMLAHKDAREYIHTHVFMRVCMHACIVLA